MKLKNGIVQSKVGEDYVVVAMGEAGRNFNGMVRNNATAAFLVERMLKETSEDELVASLLEEYEVDEATARRDVKHTIETFRNAGLLDE